ncbi:GNAT family N-acetyltransferase [Glutamicibacter ardleyensis]|uniref:GNAT family N-acetyltransferase n=1 Tax=Glutamicibacter ardleyensis TaxID=225894 RepID=UPI003FD32965
MTTYSIRGPREDEWETLADLHLRTWQETYSGKFPESEWGPNARIARIGMWKAICSAPRPGDRFAVAERDGLLVGLAGAGASQDDPAPRTTQLWFIYLLSSEQGTGAGQELLDNVLGTSPSSLWVLEENPRAISFYNRNGFHSDGSRKPTGFEAAGDEIRMIR